ncbi:MAG TPA: chloride channel protein [Terriglobia bacterium]|nr:chloride channel protein [Terriglobia bacterium]
MASGPFPEQPPPDAAPSTNSAGFAAYPFSTSIRRAATRIVQGLALREGNLFLLLAVIIGLASGLLVVCFRIAIEWTHLWLLGSALTASPFRLLVVPTAVGLVIAAGVMIFFRSVRGSGVNQTKAAVYVYDGYIPFRTVIGKFVLSALAIGSGQSLGPEDPSLQIGAGLASVLGRKLHLSREKIRLIAPVGAAAGLAAAFNAPISATIFVIEEVIGQWSAGVLGAIILAAVASVVVMRGFLGSEPLFRIPPYRLANATEFLAYAVLGVIAGFSSLIFVKLIAALRPRLKALPPWTQYLQPGAAGLLVGIIGIWFPQVMGAGYYDIDQAMHGQYIWQILALLAVFKILATTTSFVSGTPGGMFAPTLFIGAMIGGAVGGVEHHFFPALTGPVGAYALVGMGALFAGFLRVPMTSLFMVLEVSGNYSIILPVMVSNTIAYLISRKYQSVALFDLLSRQDGVELPSMEEQREESVLHVEDAMRPAMEPVLLGAETFAEALEKVKGSSEPHFLVNQGNGAWSGVTREALEHRVAQGQGDQPLSGLASGARLPWLHLDQTLDVAMRVIGDRPLLPVLNRADFGKIEGVVSLDDILKAYRRSH